MAIVPLGLVPTDGPKPNERIVEQLRILLKDAKAGRIQGIAMATAIYEPESTENKQATETIFLVTAGYEYATRAAIEVLSYRLGRFFAEQSVAAVDSVLTEEDE